MQDILLTNHVLLSKFEETVELINSKFSNRIIESIFTDHFYEPQGTYKYCCSPQRYVDEEWPHMKTFLSMNHEDKSIAIVLPLEGIQNVYELEVKFDEDQLVFNYNYNAALNKWLDTFAIKFYGLPV